MHFVHGRIFTSDVARPWVDALAIAGDRLTAAGSSDTVERLAGSGTHRIDLPATSSSRDSTTPITARPSETISREQAVVAYTRTAAYAESAERDKGTLIAGQLADLAVLSQDIFTAAPDALPATKSLLTMVGGRVVHDAHDPSIIVR